MGQRGVSPADPGCTNKGFTLHMFTRMIRQLHLKTTINSIRLVLVLMLIRVITFLFPHLWDKETDFDSDNPSSIQDACQI